MVKFSYEKYFRGKKVCLPFHPESKANFANSESVNGFVLHHSVHILYDGYIFRFKS